MTTLAPVQRMMDQLRGSKDCEMGNGESLMIGDVSLFYIKYNIFKIMRIKIHPNKIQPRASEPVSLP